MAEPVKVELGPVQETLFIPLAGRARESGRKHAVLRDPKAAEIVAAVDFDVKHYSRGWGGGVTVLRTAVFDEYVRAFLAEHPSGTVVELGTGLNTRFERVDNGQVHWFDLDLPDTITLRRCFFEDTARRRMLSASILDEHWLETVHASPGPYFFVAEGVLVYLEETPTVLSRIAGSFPGALLAFDTYTTRMMNQQHKMAARKNLSALWAWPCDDPHSLESVGLDVVRQAAVTRPPVELRHRLPARYRYTLPVLRPLVGDVAAVTLFRAR